MTDAKQLLAAAKAIQADTVALGMDKPAGHDPERLRLLEAVAEAARADARIWLDFVYGEAMSFTKYVSSRHISIRNPVLEALAALEAHDE